MYRLTAHCIVTLLENIPIYMFHSLGFPPVHTSHTHVRVCVIVLRVSSCIHFSYLEILSKVYRSLLCVSTLKHSSLVYRISVQSSRYYRLLLATLLSSVVQTQQVSNMNIALSVID